MKNLIVLGLSGRIGTMLRFHSDMATSYGLDMTGVSRNPPDSSDYGPTKWTSWPPTDDLAQVLQGADVVLNLAGVTPTTDAPIEMSEFLEKNVALSMNVLEAARIADVPRVFLASSASVYGAAGNSGEPLTECGPAAPQNDYGKSKLMMENAALDWIKPGKNPAVSSLRITTIAGADMLLQNASKAAAANTAMSLHKFASGKGPERSYISPSELSHQIFALCALQAPPPPVINLASSSAIRMEDLLEAFSNHVARLKWVFEDAPATAIESVTLDTTLLRDVLGNRTGPRPNVDPAQLVLEAQPFLNELPVGH